ncbi:MAG: SDR family oxidoreductase [Prevotella sp.]|nr:SDR family oxidoreductase [Prevotella sp.]
MKTMMITGGSSGIGRAAAELFSANGYKVYELSRHGESVGNITHIDCDVTQPEDCKRAVSKVLDEQPRIDVLISNAGMGISGAVEFTELSEARRQFDVNFFGALNITQAALPHMRKQQGGKIIFVSSMMAVFSLPFQAFYSATKSAVNSLALALRNELSPFGIEVCALMPGDIKTGFTAARNKSMVGNEVYKNMEHAVSTMEHDEQNGMSPESMARKLLSLANAKHPTALSTVGWKYHLFILLGKLLPATLAYRVIGKMY